MIQQLISDSYVIFAELAHPEKSGSINPPSFVHELPTVKYYEDNKCLLHRWLPEGILHPVEEYNGYIIGLVRDGRLYPLIGDIPHLNNYFGRVKIRINGLEVQPVLRTDSFCTQYFQDFQRPLEKIHYIVRYIQ